MLPIQSGVRRIRLFGNCEFVLAPRVYEEHKPAAGCEFEERSRLLDVEDHAHEAALW